MKKLGKIILIVIGALIVLCILFWLIAMISPNSMDALKNSVVN